MAVRSGDPPRRIIALRGDAELRQLKADLLQTAAQHTTSMIARPVSLTAVLALEGKAKVPRLVRPTVEQVKSFEPGEFVNRQSVRIDPVKAKDTDAMIRFEFTDAGNKAVALHIRCGVVEYVENADRYYRKPDFTLVLTREGWTKLYLNQATVAQLAGSNELKVTGDAAACDRVLDCSTSSIRSGIRSSRPPMLAASEG